MAARRLSRLRERVELVGHGFGALDLLSFAAVDYDGRLRSDAAPADFAGAEYACGLFEFAKL